MVIEPRSIQPFDSCTSALVQQFPPFNQDGVVRNLLRQRVLENILRIRKCGLLVNKLAGLEDSESDVQVRLRLSCYLSNELKWKISADNGQGLQQVLLVWWQPIYARGENRLDGRRNFYLSKRTGEFD